MKAELKEKVIKEARKGGEVFKNVVKIGPEPKVMAAPDAYWVQAWVCVPLSAIK